ncbi:hypothetical protein GPECTOR_79g120 [Gonium pectorale]|uniref:CoA carboxyltransferase C-terminal domain-containing protein n=1 Tax=Gonium pectorale TaxID=33097 RepID=A0A150G207_GONPE|nr:hypothetical protein GPECTOR_79g120 [Gonium pectorale]|eukprot:KXZ43841.1 hypothetical protein GPECTOR_79g120 [Gonium pectorale]
MPGSALTCPALPPPPPAPPRPQVWFPDSADKTAAAMEEFDAEGLPLFILANWRGFSGGMRDLFDGVLQAGSLIVERLRTYRQPVFVYIPAGAELRGGAWVVVDSQINAAAVEVFADPTARGGVLEPEGVCEIKFRDRDLTQMMHRIDPVITAARARGLPASDPSIKAREAALLRPYRAVARAFADMHDTPVRMAAKGVLSAIADRAFLAWAESPAGRSAIAGELRAMRCSAAEEMVSAVLDTADGREGLLAALGRAVAADDGLAMQLRLLLGSGGAAAAHGAGAGPAAGVPHALQLP